MTSPALRAPGTTFAWCPQSKLKFKQLQWQILIAVCFSYLVIATGRNNISFAFLGMQQDFGFTKAQTGTLAGMMLLFYGAGQFINGGLADIIPARFLYPIAACISCLCNLLMSITSVFWALMGLACLNGYAQAFAFPVGGRILSNWWTGKQRTWAFSILMFTTGGTTVVASAAAIMTLERADWPWVLRMPPLLMLLGALAYLLFVRSKPQDLGYPAIDAQQAALPVKQSFLQMRTAFLASYQSVLSHRRFLAACIALGFANAARYGLLIWVPIHYLGTTWQTNPSAAWLTISLPVGMALGALATGALSTWLFKRRSTSVVLFMLLSALCCLIMFLMPEGNKGFGMLLLFACGFLVFGPQTPLFALCPEMLSDKHAGTGLGVMNSIGYGFTALSEPLIGYIIDINHDDTSIIFIIIMAICLASALSATLIKK